MQSPLLSMLHIQHRYYTSELGNTHKQLGQAYKKLARIELEFIQRHEKNLTRQQKKALQWSKSLTTALLKSLESQQTWLHDYLQQCTSLIASYEGSMATPWSAVSSTDPYSPAPWSMTAPAYFLPQQQQAPQYWDLSMLHERRDSSPFAPSADSGYVEANASVFPYSQESTDLLSTNPNNGSSVAAARVEPQSKKSSVSEHDDVPELREPTVLPTQPGAPANPTRQRRYSENAIQIIENRLALPKQTRHQRGQSESATPVPHRTLSVHTAIA